MTINTIANTITIVCGAIVAVLAVIEKTHLVSAKPLSKLLHGNLGQRLDKIEDKINKVDTKVDMTDIGMLKSRISSTATLIKNGGKMTEDQYNVIFDDIDKWRKYHTVYPDLNGKVNVSIEIIEDAYKKENF